MARHEQSGWRRGLLASAAAMTLGFGGAALAQSHGGSTGSQQSQAPSQQPGSQQPAVVGQLRTAEQALGVAHGQLAGNEPPNYAQARTAVQAGLDVLGRVPQQMRAQDAWGTAQRQLDEAREVLQGSQPNEQQAVTQLREAADALRAFTTAMAGGADAGGANAAQRAEARAGQAQVNVQQPAPQITVQQQQPQITVNQPPPQVTIQQPPPQVTIQQPEPRVTVQQAQPQVSVQQAQPQVTVRQQGEPQVSVQRTGEPQVNVQRPESQHSGAAPSSANQQAAAGSTAAPPAGGAAQPAAAQQAAGMPLRSVQALVGTNVVGANGREAGEVRNLLMDGQGRVRAAVVEWGGFLGIGTREALVPIERIRLGQGNERATLTMTRAELEALPSFNSDRIATYGRERGWGEGLRLIR